MEVTVLMCVHNGCAHLSECIKSVLNQSFYYYEFLIIDDGSTDQTVDIIKTFHDPRIRLIRTKHHYIQSLNYGISEARGKYIVRIDSDDIMYKDRIAFQLNIMNKNEDIQLCSSWVRFFYSNNKEALFAPFSGWIRNPLHKLALNNYIVHSSVMLRKSFLTNNNLKYQNIPYAEDYNLWFEMLKCGANFYMTPTILTSYRLSPFQISRLNKKEQQDSAAYIKKEIKTFISSSRYYQKKQS